MEMYRTLGHFLAVSIFLTSCYGFRQTFRIETDIGDQGDTLIIRSKVPDLANLAPGIISRIRRDCLVGHWLFYPNKNYIGSRSPINVQLQERCWDTGTLPFTGSVRYLGPKDTDTESISFYSQTHFHGDEVVVEASTDYIPFLPGSLFSTGMSRWTLYPEPYYRGQPVCYIPNYFFHYNTPMNGTVVRSVSKGCVGSIKNYMFPTNNETE